MHKPDSLQTQVNCERIESNMDLSSSESDTQCLLCKPQLIIFISPEYNGGASSRRRRTSYNKW